MEQQPRLQEWLRQQLARYPLLDALRGRRARRFGWGMQIDHGPLSYTSPHAPSPLSEDEEAALAFAACGISGHSLADLSFGRGQGGSMLGGLVGRTIGSPDSLNAVGLFVINDEATYFLKRPQDFANDEIPDLIRLSSHLDEGDNMTELYRRMRVKIRDGRAEVPVTPGLNFNINQWSLYAKGGTYFLPVNDLSAIYINALLESFSPEMGLYVIDERNMFAPAGIGQYAKSRGGWLNDDPRSNHVVTMQGLEMSLAEAVAVEQGAMLQNLGLMTQLIGLGGFANYARAEFAWFPELRFRLEKMTGSQYAGAAWWMTFFLKLLGRDFDVAYPVGLEKDGKVLMHAYTPPYYANMTEAVHAWVEHKFGKNGVYRGGITNSDYKDPKQVEQGIQPPDPKAIEATAACCEYIFKRYGRFPAYSAPFRTVIGYQATRVDVGFYDRFYRPEALTETQRQYPGN
jgi:hypothetical protein